MPEMIRDVSVGAKKQELDNSGRNCNAQKQVFAT